MIDKCNFRKLKLVTNPHGASGTHLLLVPGLHELLMKKKREGNGDNKMLIRKPGQYFNISKLSARQQTFQLPWKADGSS